MTGNAIPMMELTINLFNADEIFWAETGFFQEDRSVEIAPERAPIFIDLNTLHRISRRTQEYAQLISKAIFSPPNLVRFFRNVRAIAQHAGSPLRLRIQIDNSAKDLHGVRWELLLDPDDDTYLAKNQNLLFSRFLASPDWSETKPRPGSGARVLALIANPKELSDAEGLEFYNGPDTTLKLAPVDVQGELSRIDEVFKGCTIKTLTSTPGSAGAASLSNLAHSLLDGYDFLYLVCHGALLPDDPMDLDSPVRSYLVLENESGALDRVEGERLVEVIKKLSVEKRPRMVFLASCQSAGKLGVSPSTQSSSDDGALAAIGPRLVQSGIPAVIAMQDNVLMDTIRRFFPAFIIELLKSGQVEQSMSVARQAIDGQSDWWVPVLYTRLRKGQLFEEAKGLAVANPPRLLFEPETIYIPAGSFLMGSDEKSARPQAETPQRLVDLPAYRIGKYPITNEQYVEFIRQSGRMIPPEAGWYGQRPPPDQLIYPILGITWYDAMAYCEWLSAQTGRKYTLPNEAQWEKAARGLDGRLYPWGEAYIATRLNTDTERITPVDAFEAQSVYGLYDLVGNVREWTVSLWGENPLEPEFKYPWKPDARNNPDANRLVRRIVRGGAATDPPDAQTCTSRGSVPPDRTGVPKKRTGFRVVWVE